jgi:dTDP-4-amino-4,6-dideoxygalactose transaminase
MTAVPLVDLRAQHAEIAAEVEAGFARVLGQTAFILGEDVAAFEGEFAQFSSVRHCIGVANGTDALELALRALGIGRGDEVIVPTNSFVATALAAVRTGATVVLVDCDPTFLLIDAEAVRARLGPRTRAIMPVHLYGQAAPMEALVATGAGKDVVLVEDAAQAQGARRHGRMAGGLGAIAGTSFYPGKNLGAYGDAGAVLTDSDALADRVRALRNYGSTVKYDHRELGFNSRLDTLQAVVLRAKLRRLATWNAARREAARRYDTLLADLSDVRRPATLPGNEHVWHLYAVRVPHRDAVLQHLNAAGIGAGIHYPVPIHLQPAFSAMGYRRGEFPQAERAAGELLSLPLFPEITSDQQERVVSALRAALADAHGRRGS